MGGLDTSNWQAWIQRCDVRPARTWACQGSSWPRLSQKGSWGQLSPLRDSVSLKRCEGWKEGRRVLSSIISRCKMEGVNDGSTVTLFFLFWFSSQGVIILVGWWILSGYVSVDHFDCFTRFGYACVQISPAGPRDVLEQTRRSRNRKRFYSLVCMPHFQSVLIK